MKGDYTKTKRAQISPRQRDEILNAHGNKCDNCESTKDLDIHHIVPLCFGGEDTLSNMCVLCLECHKKAHGKKINNKTLGIRNSGRKPKLPDEYEKIASDYIFGFIGRKECREQLGGRLEPADLKRHKWFGKILRGCGVKDFHNYVDGMKSGWGRGNGELNTGMVCGYVVLADGSRKDTHYLEGVKN